MTLREALDVTKIYSVAGLLSNHAGVVSARPFRFPHHTISQTALVGGVSFAGLRESFSAPREIIRSS